MNKFTHIAEIVIFSLLIVLSFYIYVEVSQLWAILLVIFLIVILSLTLLINAHWFLPRIKHRKLIKVLNQYSVVRESEIQKKLQWDPSKIHERLFELSKVWQTGPMILFVKSYYIYISKSIVEEILKKYHEFIIKKDTDNNHFNNFKKWVMTKYGFKTRVEIDGLISFLSKKGLLGKEA